MALLVRLLILHTGRSTNLYIIHFGVPYNICNGFAAFIQMLTHVIVYVVHILNDSIHEIYRYAKLKAKALVFSPQITFFLTRTAHFCTTPTNDTLQTESDMLGKRQQFIQISSAPSKFHGTQKTLTATRERIPQRTKTF